MTHQAKTFTPRVIVQMLFFIVVIPLLPLLISGRWDWWEAWVYALISILGFVASRLLVARRHPDLLAERARFTQHEDAEPWDKLLSPLVGLGGGLVLLVAGLDALFGWSAAFSLPLKTLALLIILAGYVMGAYALIAKPLLLGHGTPANRSRPPGGLHRSLPLDAPSRLRRGVVNLPGNTSLPRFKLGIPASAVDRNWLGHPYIFGRQVPAR
jgi:hypothetical protein